MSMTTGKHLSSWPLPHGWKFRIGMIAVVAGALVIGALLYSMFGLKLQKQYWATSLTNSVNNGILRGLYEAVDRGEIGWLDVDPSLLFQRWCLE
jgi:hypothetical protein